MRIIKDLFGDNRVKTAKNAEVQWMLDYMYNTYEAYIEEFGYQGSLYYSICCRSKKYFNLLYQNGLFKGAHVIVPVGKGEFFNSKTEAYEGLVWLYNFFEEKADNKRKDREWF